MPTTHYSLSLNEPMSRLVVEISENSKYADLENAVRASVVFTALVQRECRLLEDEIASLDKVDAVESVAKAKEGKKISVKQEMEIQNKIKSAYFRHTNLIVALHRQLEGGQILKTQSLLKDFD